MLFELLENFSHRDHVALEGEGFRLTYRELGESARSIAGRLRLGPEGKVAVLADKGPEAVAAIWGVLAAGGAYVPLNVQDPLPRLRSIVKQAGPQALLCSPKQEAKARELASAMGRPPILLDREIFSPAPEFTPGFGKAACLFPTSGSTGEPKLVVIERRSVEAFVSWAVEEFAFGPDDRIVSIAPFSFDLSVLDLFGAAAVGAKLLIPPAGITSFPVSLHEWIEENGVTSLYLVPSLLVALVKDAPRALGGVKRVLFAGEVFPPTALPALFRTFPSAVLANLYGPTETNVCAYHVLDRKRDYATGIPIGRACPFNELRLEPEGEGEIRVKGENVMRGYIGGPPAEGSFCTGDLARRGPDGELFFLGRKDQMLKRKGYRIEPAEIESAFSAHPEIEAAVVIAAGEGINLRIGLALKALKGHLRLSDLELRRLASESLPAYMAPDFYRWVDDWPFTSSGKIDRRALREHLFPAP